MTDTVERERTSFQLVKTQRTISTDRKSTRLNSSHLVISYAVFCLKKHKDVRVAGVVRGHLREEGHVDVPRSQRGVFDGLHEGLELLHLFFFFERTEDRVDLPLPPPLLSLI